jgi:hypothetical protein
VGPRTGLDAVARRKNPRPCREPNPGRPTHSLVTVLTELPQLIRFVTAINEFKNQLRMENRKKKGKYLYSKLQFICHPCFSVCDVYNRL